MEKEAAMNPEQIQSEQTYTWCHNTRRYHFNGQAIGSMYSPRTSEWTVRFTRPQSSNLPWTEFHTPAILSEYTFATDTADKADAHAKDWLVSQLLRHVYGDDIADVIEDFFALKAAVARP